MSFPRNMVALVALLLAACAHKGARAPAADTPPTCAGQMAVTFNGGDLQRIFAQTQISAAQNAEFYQTTYPKNVRAFLTVAGSPKRDCETERDVQAYAADLDNKLKSVAAIIHAAAVNKPLVMFGADRSGETLACFSACESELAQGHSQSRTCEAQCGVDEAYSQFFFQNLPLVRLMNTCFTAGTDPAGNRAEFLTQFQKFVPSYVEVLKQQQPELKKLADVFSQAKTALEGLRPEINHAAGQPHCPAANYNWLPSVRAAVVPVRTNVDSGTAFYAQAGSQRVLVTAMHVPRLSPQFPTGPLTVVDGAGNVKANFTTTLSPDRSDIARDIELTASPPVGPALKVVGSQEIPTVGQRFYVVGFPAGKFTVTRCTFQGFGARINGLPDAAYRLFCPGVGNLHSASGGPAVDDKGRVWAVNSEIIPLESVVMVSPLALSAANKLVMGIQQVFPSATCFAKGDKEPHECQVIPNRFEENGP